MDSSPMQTYARELRRGAAPRKGVVTRLARRQVARKAAAKFKKSYQSPAVGGSSFTGAGSAGGGIGG